LLAAGASLAYAAYAAGFADQSHLSRKFKEAYATTPRRFVREVEGAAVCARTTTGRAAEQGTVALRRAV
jgi:AraC-like DNA-binding protein